MSYVNIPANTWTEIPGTGLRACAVGPGSGALAQVLPDGIIRLRGAYEVYLAREITPAHLTCVDVTPIDRPPRSEYVCGPGCPLATDQL